MVAAYATPDNVRAVLARKPGEWAGTAAELSDEALTNQIKSAQAQVDGRLSVRYRVPFDPVPGLVADITRDIAAYLADLTYRQGLDYESDRDPVVLRYQQAIAMLERIATGQVDLPDAPEIGGLLSGRNRYGGALFGLDDFGLKVRGGGHVQ
ncbi:phage protein Gp36 family protein [Saccharopolyspora sp. NPDC002376]